MNSFFKLQFDLLRFYGPDHSSYKILQNIPPRTYGLLSKDFSILMANLEKLSYQKC
jgi:hypothetical protein